MTIVLALVGDHSTAVQLLRWALTDFWTAGQKNVPWCNWQAADDMADMVAVYLYVEWCLLMESSTVAVATT